MRRAALIHPLATLTYGLVAGGLIVSIALQPPAWLRNTSPPPQLPRIQVAAGEDWARAWDVANGEPVNLVNGPPSQIIANLYAGNERVGHILADGRAIVFRFSNVKESAVLLCNPKPAFPYPFP